MTVQAYASGREFFAGYAGDRPGCLVLEQRIFDISGLQIQRRLAEQNQRLPLVYVTSGMDISTAVALMRGGAIHVLEKPLRSIELLAAIQEALAIDEHQRRHETWKCRVKESIALLTRKERQLVGLVACAKSTQAIAAELSIGGRAVALRRRAVMDKLGLRSSHELLRFAILAWQDYSPYLDSASLKAGRIAIMTEAEVIRIMRGHLEGLFPKVCVNCHRRYVTLAEYLLQTDHVGPAIPYDVELGDWNPLRPIGTVTFANCLAEVRWHSALMACRFLNSGHC